MSPLLAELPRLIDMGEAAAWMAYLVFFRVGAAMALLPAFGEQIVPTRIRLVATLAFTLILAPTLADRPLPPPGFAALGIEVAAGLMIGAGLRLLVIALQIAGSIAAQSTSLSQIFGSMGADPQPAMGAILTMAGLALAVSTGLHLRVVELFILSYDLLPPGACRGHRTWRHGACRGWDMPLPWLSRWQPLRHRGHGLQPVARRDQPRDAAVDGGLCRGPRADPRGFGAAGTVGTAAA